MTAGALRWRQASSFAGLLFALLAGFACWNCTPAALAAEPPPAAPSDTRSQSVAQPQQAQPVGEQSAEQYFRQLLAHQVKAADEQQTKQALDQIPARPEYSEESAPRERRPTWLSRFFEWLGQLFDRMGIAHSGPVSVVVISALALLLIYAVIRLVWGVLAKQRARQVAPGEAGGGREHSEEELLAQAQRAMSSGQYREAIRMRYLALLRRLGVPAVALQTNTQLARRVARDWPQAGAQFKSLVLCYEDAWYGALPCGAEDYREANELAGAVHQTLAAAAQEAGA